VRLQYNNSSADRRHLSYHSILFLTVFEENFDSISEYSYTLRKIPLECGFSEFIRLTDLENPANHLLPDDTLTIFCHVVDKKVWETNFFDMPEQPHTIPQFLHDFIENLPSIIDDKYADFVFFVQNVKIQAHRAFLASRSPVFADMSKHDTQENKTNEAEINDMTPAAFRAFLRFIYTGQRAEEFLIAANKYDIPKLKQFCAKELRKKLTANNAVDLLILSDLPEAEDLKEGVMFFINKNAPAVTATWSNIPENH
jgi:speckle-type POZ protein